MSTYTTHQSTGGRKNQCDATAVATVDGVRAYVLLDGIGDDQAISQWAATAAQALATTAARMQDAEAGLRSEYARYAADEDRRGPWELTPKACAVVAVEVPGQPLTVAWSGDARAYLLQDGTLTRLTRDHNERRTGGSRHRITSCLGATATDEDTQQAAGHNAVEAVTVPAQGARLVLASDGAYEPHEDNGLELTDVLVGTPAEAAAMVVQDAVELAGMFSTRPDNATALVADLA
ncbi:PP2C family protein-serine/threonine phosphatase [Streptomyces werraensis]|uniref:PP2C family protein-serine/threonine phosphatase n=1 Tax=Streptomyces werraensis TaxID=68284 RepID=UPI00382B0F5A